MARIGLLTMSDGRDYVANDIREFVQNAEKALVAALEADGHEVVVGVEEIWTNQLATSEARRVAAARPDLTIFHYPVWAFPHFTMLAAASTNGPLLLLASLDPVQPGMVGMLAGGGALDQIGRVHSRAWGGLTEEVAAQIRAATAVSRLCGSTFGKIGGRPMGMNTATANTDQWMATFGIDVEEIDQWEIVRRSEHVEQSRVTAGREWLERHAAGVHYDGKQLTPELLERQIRSYYAMRELIDEWNLDFSGIKGQPELTSHFTTMDITEAFLNDPYDWEGPKETHVTATEADMDGALTMQILKLLSGDPVLFADVRHYHSDLDIWDLANSGQHATWYAARSADPLENLAKTHFYPEVFFFPAGGASVHHIAAPGDATFARLTRLNGRYRLHVARGAFESYSDAENERLARLSTFEWPHAFTRLQVDASEFLSTFGANHIHAVPGDRVAELRAVARLLDIDWAGLGPLA
ncbi:L-fucose/L-arabinose isomerase family protein [Cryptosporangium arvum]|uniref:FucIase n=1 Tax=Cryptosporangium arvum DSM 44712 TaxID=927661 RepID=A0A010ZQ40_9ACTN|nr:L-fucose/L-arabinose isomerase family protein [Cryptosporangium arvum]EXG79312.1 L-fucose isomerase family protein [Cryptosporangium arvum DSM 44712]